MARSSRTNASQTTETPLGTFGRYAGPATLILASLAEGPKHGYALTKDIEEFAGLRLAPGTLYEALSRLEGQHLIAAVPSEDRRKPYKLTSAGAAALRAHLERAAGGRRRGPDPPGGQLGCPMTRSASPEVRARRMLRLYPASWRARYADEYTELLVADLIERPHCPARTLDVCRGGLVARMNNAGLVGPVHNPEGQASVNLAVLGSAVALFLTLGVSVWAQLSIGWQWSAPSTAATTMSMVVMSTGVLLFAVLAAVAAVPVVLALVRALVRHDGRGLGRPLALAGSGGAVMLAGSVHFASGWPGTGGHPWAHQGLVPGGLAAFAWASTLSVTSYWAHPSALAAFPPAEIAWMVVSPLALCSVSVGSVKLVRHVDLSVAALRFEVLVGSLVAIAMEAFLGAACWWVLVGGSGPRGLFRTGFVDVAAVCLMAVAVAVALRATQRGRQASVLLRTQ